jgi:hypothetical protein
MKLIRLTLTGVLCLGTSVFAEENAEILKQRIIAQAQSVAPNDYAFTRTVSFDIAAAGNRQKTVRVEKYDPTKPAAARWSLVSVNGAAPSAKALRKFRREVRKRPSFGYHRLATYFAAPAAAVADAEGRTVFHLASLPKGSIIVGKSDISRLASADVVVTEGSGNPFAEQVHLSLEPTRRLLVFKLDRCEVTCRFAVGPEGKPLLVDETAEMAGSGLGFKGRLRSVATYSDYRFVGGIASSR